eukprot:scaffold10494_cov53-Phaeocystis_antarctica.AAC.4
MAPAGRATNGTKRRDRVQVVYASRTPKPPHKPMPQTHPLCDLTGVRLESVAPRHVPRLEAAHHRSEGGGVRAGRRHDHQRAIGSAPMVLAHGTCWPGMVLAQLRGGEAVPRHARC